MMTEAMKGQIPFMYSELLASHKPIDSLGSGKSTLASWSMNKEKNMVSLAYPAQGRI
jgi:hypothetical protein